MEKMPRAVRPISVDISLEPMPRLNFGKIYIVEHNVKVHTIGKITEDSMQRFHIYAEEQQDVS